MIVLGAVSAISWFFISLLNMLNSWTFELLRALAEKMVTCKNNSSYVNSPSRKSWSCRYVVRVAVRCSSIKFFSFLTPAIVQDALAVFTVVFEVVSAFATTIRSYQALQVGVTGGLHSQKKGLTYLILEQGMLPVALNRKMSLFWPFLRSSLFHVGLSTSAGLLDG